MDAYTILGVAKDASLEEIKAAYHLKAKKHHPDKGGDDWAFKHVRAAYEQLLEQRVANRDTENTAHEGFETPEQRQNAHSSVPVDRADSQLPFIFAGLLVGAAIGSGVGYVLALNSLLSGFMGALIGSAFGVYLKPHQPNN